MINITDMKFYSTDVAIKVGVIPAIIYTHICYWVEKNKANDRNYVDGKYWTYNSASGFTKYFPEFTEKQIKYALSKLISANLIEKGRHNKCGYDKTNWYTVKDSSETANTKDSTKPVETSSIAQKSGVLSIGQNDTLPSDKFVRPIPKDNNKKNSTERKIYKKKVDDCLAMEDFEETEGNEQEANECSNATSEALEKQAGEIYALYPRKKARKRAIIAIKTALKSEGYTNLYTKTQKYAEAVKESGKHLTYIPYASTWFNGEEYNDDWSDLFEPDKPTLRGGIDRTKYDGFGRPYQAQYNHEAYLDPNNPNDFVF